MFEVDGHFVQSQGKKHKFPDLIAESLIFDDILVVRLAGDPSKRSNRNVYAVDNNAKVLWQIPDRHHMNEHSPYVGLYRSDIFVEAFNWDGTSMKLDPRRGTVYSEGYVHTEFMSRRPRPTKHYL